MGMGGGRGKRLGRRGWKRRWGTVAVGLALVGLWAVIVLVEWFAPLSRRRPGERPVKMEDLALGVAIGVARRLGVSDRGAVVGCGVVAGFARWGSWGLGFGFGESGDRRRGLDRGMNIARAGRFGARARAARRRIVVGRAVVTRGSVRACAGVG